MFNSTLGTIQATTTGRDDSVEVRTVQPVSSYFSIAIANCDVPVDMSRILKHLLLLLIAIQLAIPVGWCCRAPRETSVAVGVSAPAHSCCGQRQVPSKVPASPIQVGCCCSKEATKTASFKVPESAPLGTVCEWLSLSHPTTVAAEIRARGIGRHEGRHCARHIELCVWRC